MTNGHIISNESNSFNVTHGFNTKVRFSKGDVLVNLTIQNEW
jgi:hypothetical protein